MNGSFMGGDVLAAALRALVSWLEWPVVLALLVGAVLALFDAGVAIGERLGGLRALSRDLDPESLEALEARLRRRVERSDLFARVGPMLGLMGTLIPLGPGLAALGQGDPRGLADAVTVAFDTTVLGLAIGMVGFAIGRIRRRWYDALLDAHEDAYEGAP